MKVDFQEQVFANFKAFSGNHKLRWDSPGVTYVAGLNKFQPALASNGSGKSSTSDALCWCLYGKTPGNLRNPDIQPWVRGGSPSVTEHITIDGQLHTVQRTASPNRLLLDDREVAQDAIDDLIGMGFDLFTNTVLLAQGQPLFYDLKPTEKMELFSTTLNWDRWDLRSKAASAKADAADRELTTITFQKEAGARALEEIEQTLIDVRKRAEDWAAKTRVDARNAKARLATLQQEHAAKDKQLATALLREDSAGTELRAQTAEVRKLEQALIKGRAGVQAHQTALETARESLEEEFEALGRAKACPTCGQPVKPSNLESHRAYLKAEIAEFDAKIKAGIPAKVTTAISTLERQLTQAKKHEEEFHNKADSARSEVDRLRPEMATLNAQIAEARRVANAETENPFTAQISTLTKRKAELSALLKAAEKKIVETSARAERYRLWIKYYKDIKLQLVDDILQELEIVTNGMLDAVGLTDWEVRYDIERETRSGSIQRVLNVQINSPQSKGFVKWESWSGGEQQRLRLIGALALSDVLLAHAGVQTNLEVLDEPAQYFSTEGVQELCAFLAERARETGKSIWYTEHQAVESTHFTNTLTVIRDEKGSYIE